MDESDLAAVTIDCDGRFLMAFPFSYCKFVELVLYLYLSLSSRIFIAKYQNIYL